MHLFYCQHISITEAVLSPEESAHCVRVLRLGKGDKVHVTDGNGHLFEAIIAVRDAGKCLLEIVASLPVPTSRNFKLHMAIAPTKNIDRFEWFIEKSVEIGIDSITPLLCQRSERRVLKTERLQKLIISTMKQALVTRLPLLSELTDFRMFIDNYSGPQENRFIAHCEDPGRTLLKDTLIPAKDAIVLIGPEGDFSPLEIELATNHGFIPVSLGNNRLRTETAGIVACCLMNS